MLFGRERHKVSLYFLIFVLIIATVTAGDQVINDDDFAESSCDQSECMRCDLQSGECLKCLHVMMESTHHCVSHCPIGHATQWRDDTLYQGTVCTPGSLLSAITGRDVAVIACAAAGGAVCVGIILGAIIYTRRQASLKPLPDDTPVRSNRIPVPRLWRDPRPSAADTTVSTEERKEFLKTLAALRRNAPLLLEMLTETRARFRGIKGPDNTMDTKSRAYRAVVRDLNRVVALIARREDSFQCVPADWRRLLAWADRLLQRYRRTREDKCGQCQTCQHHKKSSSISSSTSSSSAISSSTSSSSVPQPLFLTRQQVQEESWRKQREEGKKIIHYDKLDEELVKPAFIPMPLEETLKKEKCAYFQDDELTLSKSEEDLQFSPDLQEVLPPNYLKTNSTFCTPNKVIHMKEDEMELSYSQDELALANQKAQINVVDEKKDIKINSNNNNEVISNSKSNKKDKSMISRIFCTKILSNGELSLSSNENGVDKNNLTKVNTLQEDECMSSTSIYDHIEAFTFDDFNLPSKNSNNSPNPKNKIEQEKPKPKNTSNVNLNRLRKPNFPGYSESFKQILDKRNLLNIQKSKIQKRLSRKGEQFHKIVRRSESRFTKDRNKMDPNTTYDRRNVKSEVVNNEVVGGDVYVTIVKQPVVKRTIINTSNNEIWSGSYENLDEVRSEVSDVVKNSSVDSYRNIKNNSKEKGSHTIRCEILTVV